MGWDFWNVDTWNGKIDRRKEMDRQYTWETDTVKVSVVRSAMRGSTYYAAIERLEKLTNNRTVHAVVGLTKTDSKDYFNFGCKTMDETMGPYYYDCPKSILDLLTETDNQSALDWRAKCRERAEKPNIGKLPIGTVIEFKAFGNTYRAEKMSPNHQFKTSWWLCDNGKYMPKKYIHDFVVC